jgi:uncharacterized membrane protein
MRIGGQHSHLTLLVGFFTAACSLIFFLEPWGHDTWYHLQRLLDIEAQISRGTLYAHFAENAAQGKGLPVWIYYSQWIYWPAILLKFLGASPLISLKIVYCILLAVCCVGCYLLLRLHAEKGPAVFGTLLFITSNYVIGEIFQRSAYAEFFSVAFMPLLLFMLNGTLRNRGRATAAGLVIIASIMILAHPLSFMNAGWALLAYMGYVTIRDKVSFLRLLQVFFLFLLALALTAFYWLPAVIETRFVLGAEGVPTPLLETFLTIPRYFKFYSILSLGFVLTIYSLAAIGGLLLRRDRHKASTVRASWPLVAGIGIYVFLTLGVSEPLYVNIPFLASNLWVWRVLFPLTLLVVILVISNFQSLPQGLRSEKFVTVISLLAVAQATVFVLFYTVPDISLRRLDIDEINGELAKEMLRLEGFGIDEYLPQPRMLPRPRSQCHSIQTVAPNGFYRMRFAIKKDETGTCIHIPKYWNTRYIASIDGSRVPVFADANGDILIVPDSKTGIVTVNFSRPVYVTLSTYLSGASALLLLLGLARSRLSAAAGESASDGR